jgi:hypothetical protein
MRLDPLRAARGANPTFTPANFGAVALFNNSTGAHILRVWLISGSSGGSATIDLNYSRTRLTNQNAGIISPLVPMQQAPPGMLDTDDLAVAPTPDFYAGIPFEPMIGQGNPYPIAFLPPGWSLVCTAEIAGHQIALSFLWDYIYAEQLLTLSAGDSATDI